MGRSSTRSGGVSSSAGSRSRRTRFGTGIAIGGDRWTNECLFAVGGVAGCNLALLPVGVNERFTSPGSSNDRRRVFDRDDRDCVDAVLVVRPAKPGLGCCVVCCCAEFEFPILVTGALSSGTGGGRRAYHVSFLSPCIFASVLPHQKWRVSFRYWTT